MYLTMPNTVSKVTMGTINGPTFTITLAKLMKEEIEKRSFENAIMEQPYILSDNTTIGHRAKREEDFPPVTIDSARSQTPLTDVSDMIKTNQNTLSKLTSSH